MLTLKIDNENVENIFFNEFHSNKEKFFEFIQNSYEIMHSKKHSTDSHLDLIEVQEASMFKTWDNNEDKAWDEL